MITANTNKLQLNWCHSLLFNSNKLTLDNNFQIRIDFSTFAITGPNTVTTSFGYEVGGSIAGDAGKKISTATQCQTDTFSLTGPAGSVPPVICGTNTGEHGKLNTFNKKVKLFNYECIKSHFSENFNFLLICIIVKQVLTGVKTIY
jgi:hypothetical protein